MNECELAVLQILWGATEPTSECQITDAVGTGQSTVEALESLQSHGHIKRLVEDGQVRYTAVLGKRQYGMMLMEDLVQNYYNGSWEDCLRECLGMASEHELREIKKLTQQ